ncbi:MAG: isoleucine--tRNA ligase, partial [Myxococcales bacterium]|nr:isoleucine--tRNA ligase [Myxococcales bacterium]
MPPVPDRDPAETPYPDLPQQANFPELEKRVLEEWQRRNTFERSVSGRASGANGSNEFVFYDGPPFANGLPHFGHLLTGYVKDIVPRYQTLRGKRVERRFGWDCHGLPAEMEAERELGVSGRLAIQEFGIDRFNEHCRQTVLRYTGEWERYVTRQARWVDFQNDYKTMDTSYIESVMWAFKTLYDRDLLYEGYRVLPYSWACETPVSNFETRLDDSYRERQDPAVTVRFTLSEPRDGKPVDVLAWTTTPWTLPSNLALAVGPEITYAAYELDGRLVILGAECAEQYGKELGDAPQVGTFAGRELVGASYNPPFDYFLGRANAHRILSADWIDTAEGTGVVHMAPGFGEDDMETCRAADIEVVCPVDDHGRFTAEVPDFEGMQVFDANTPIIRKLREAGKLFRHESYVHNYPHCWRTDTPLIYRAVNSWYVRVTAFRDRMVELNREINWIPEHVKEGLFGNWIANARDWSISRNRFWGSPIPVWKSDDPNFPRLDVYGSLDDIERDFGVRPDDLHRPAIDELTRSNPDDPSGRSMMRRIPDVLDGWFDSGSMPFAQVHYPFENRDWFDNHSPADFIVEYVAQTRGWFYTLMVLGTALFDRPPFRNCICHGVTLAEDGQKLSKRLRNYPDPEEVFETHGSDALRWHLVSSPLLKGGDLKVEKDGKAIGDVVRNVLN